MAGKKKVAEVPSTGSGTVVAAVMEPPADVELVQVQMIPVRAIRPSPVNPRKFHGVTESLQELSQNIEKVWLQQPVLVRPVPRDEMTGVEYELVFGERRWRACGLVMERRPERVGMPAFVRELGDEAAYELTLSENMHREDLSPLEEANGVASYLDMGRTHEEIADRLGKPVGWVARRAKLRDLSEEWREAVADPGSDLHVWTASHLELIARFMPEIQKELLERYRHTWNTAKMSAKYLRKELADYLLKLAAAPWKISEPGPGEIVACVKCDRRTSCQPHLFEEEAQEVKGDQCLDKGCWGKKLEIFVKEKEKELRKSNPKLMLWDNSRGESRLPKESALLKLKEQQTYKYTEVKKQTDEAIPALIIDGAGAGTVKWFVRDKSYENALGSSRPIGEDGKALPKTMKERREALEKRRNKALLERAQELLVDEMKNPCRVLRLDTLQMMRFVGQSSLQVTYEFHESGRVEGKKLRRYIDEGNGEEQNQDEMRLIAVRLLRRALFSLERDINCHLQGACNPEDAVLAFFLMGLNVADIQEEIRKKIKEPKAWADLNEDGTPKKK
jgi:ParB/RepB/Spo0J family partition protein